MTEAEWQTATDPEPMLAFVQRAGRRKLQLFAVACCRDRWDQITADRSRRAVEILEAHADGLSTEAELAAACRSHERTFGRHPHDGTYYGVEAALEVGSGGHPQYVLFAVPPRSSAAERADQCSVLRDLFGNPFRPVTLQPEWLTSTVVGLAEGAYRDRAWDRLPILADALQDAGCDCEELLGHCRSVGLHCRGCWAVDLLTGRG